MTITARLPLVMSPGDFPGTPDAATKKALDELFAMMFPGQENPRIAGDHAAIGALARDPRLATMLVQTTGYLVRQTPWIAQHADLRELAIQTLNLHYRCDFSFQSHIGHWQHFGLTPEQLAALPFWRSANVFDDEQKLVIEYTLAVVRGEVPDALWDRVVAQYGEQGALELSIAVAWWSLWAMIINAAGIRVDFGFGRAKG